MRIGVGTVVPYPSGHGHGHGHGLRRWRAHERGRERGLWRGRGRDAFRGHGCEVQAHLSSSTDHAGVIRTLPLCVRRTLVAPDTASPRLLSAIPHCLHPIARKYVGPVSARRSSAVDAPKAETAGALLPRLPKPRKPPCKGRLSTSQLEGAATNSECLPAANRAGSWVRRFSGRLQWRRPLPDGWHGAGCG